MRMQRSQAFLPLIVLVAVLIAYAAAQESGPADARPASAQATAPVPVRLVQKEVRCVKDHLYTKGLGMDKDEICRIISGGRDMESHFSGSE